MSKQALIDVAEKHFTEPGYSHTSLDTIVAEAHLTKGALYHHFSGKQAIFESVFARIEARAAQQIRDASSGYDDPWERARAGLRAYLTLVQQPAYRRVVVQDGPSVLGHERFREHEARSTYAILREIITAAFASTPWSLSEEMLGTLTQLFFGALNAAGNNVALTAGPAQEATRVAEAVDFLMRAVQNLAAQGGAAPGATSPS